MKRTIIASILSLSLAATSFTATPARADEDVFKVIAGLVVLGAIANAAKNDREERRAREAQAQAERQRAKARSQHVTRNNSRIFKHPHLRSRNKIAPQRCLRDQWTHRGTRQVYGARCMQRHSQAQLPQTCLRQNQTNSGPRHFYGPRCLRQQGWRA